MITVENFNLYYSKIPLKKPFVTALRRVEYAESVVLELQCSGGIIGYGAASPTAAVTGDTLGSIAYALSEILVPPILGKPIERDSIENIGVGLLHNSGAKSALDIALFDSLAKSENLPLYRYLGGAKREYLNDITISVGSPEKMATDSLEAVKSGVKALKLKLCGDGFDDERVSAVSKTVPNAQLRLDPNQSWTFDEAKRVLDKCKGTNITLVEQPFPCGDRISGKLLRKYTDIPIMADESVFTSEDATAVLRGGEADIVNIKLAKSGGIAPSLKINNVTKREGGACIVGCMLESPIAVVAAAHFALACDNCVGVDLDVPCLLEYDPVESDISFGCGKVTVTGDGAGLGIKQLGELRPIGNAFLGG